MCWFVSLCGFLFCINNNLCEIVIEIQFLVAKEGVVKKEQMVLGRLATGMAGNSLDMMVDIGPGVILRSLWHRDRN